MSYLDFKKEFYPLACFNINQVYAWYKNFDSNNLTRWIKRGLLIRLKQGYYSFPEYKHNPGFLYVIANKIYKPSYISLHSALSYYGMIPEAIIQITSVTALKTAVFKNDFGEFSYKTLKDHLIFAYHLIPQADNFTIKMAQPEKALLDLLYLYPSYSTEKEMQYLRLDEDFLQDDIDLEKMMEYLDRFKNKTLDKRVKLLIKSYEL
jgi:predicted transcriptional regulator of viral defense system